MSAALASVPTPRVFAADGLVHITDVTTADPDLLAIVSSAADPEAVVQRALSTGARALSVAQASIDTTMVEQSFAELTRAFAGHLDQARTQVVGAAGDLLNDPGHGVAASLQTWRREVDALLDATFNPERSGSALGKFDRIMQDSSAKQLKATRQLLNPDADDSPLARVLSGVKEQVSGILDAVARLSEQVAADRASTSAVAATMERSAIKGQAYEDQVVSAVTAVAAARGDVADPVGRVGGTAGNQVGDIVVEVDPAATGGTGGRYVVECKDRRLSVKAVLDELRRASANRDAQAAIAVFSRPEHAPIDEPFSVFDDRAIVVYDKDHPDPASLRLACAWARWIVQRDVSAGDVAFDAELIGKIIDQARQALGRRTNVRRAHAAATKKIQEAAAQVDELHDDLLELIERIERSIES